MKRLDNDEDNKEAYNIIKHFFLSFQNYDKSLA